MKLLPVLIVASLIFLASCTSAENPPAEPVKVADQPVETLVYDLNNDSQPDTLLLTVPPVPGNPGEFRKVTIALSGKGRASFTAKDIWGTIHSNFSNENKNAVTSNRAFVYRDSTETLVLLFGYIHGEGKDEFSVIRISDNACKMVFDSPLDHPKLEDVRQMK